MSKVAYWPPGSMTEVPLPLTLADVCRFLVTDWLPTLPISASRSVIGWPYFIMSNGGGTSLNSYWVIRTLAGWSERQWKGVLSWMLGVAGTRRVMAEEGYRWIAPVSAFYPERRLPVATPFWHPTYPPSVMEIDADPQNKSRLRPDYIAIRPLTDGSLEFALVESKGTSRCLSNMSSCPQNWRQQVRNGIATVQGSPLPILRHLVVATRCNPNGVRERSRRIQIRAWNSRFDESDFSGARFALFEVISALFFGFLRNLGMWNNLRALQLALTSREERSPFIQSNFDRITEQADAELRYLADREPDSPGDLSYSIRTDLGTFRIRISPQAIDLIRLLRSGIHNAEAMPSVYRYLDQLEEWYKKSRLKEEDTAEIAVDRSGFIVDTKEVKFPNEL